MTDKIKTPKEMAEKEVNKKLAKAIAEKELEKKRLQARIKKLDKDINKIEDGELVPDSSEEDDSSDSTHISFLLDESGSMQGSDAIKTVNEYIQAMKNEKGKITFTLTQFNSEHVKISIKNRLIKKVKTLTDEDYNPGGLTPLLDAIGKTVGTVETKGKVLFVILTDGQENASKEYTKDSIKKLIKEKESKGWKFSYLGVGLEAWGKNEDLGICSLSSMDVSRGQMRAGGMSFAQASSSFHRTGDFKIGKKTGLFTKK